MDKSSYEIYQELKHTRMEFTKHELDLIWCSLEDSLNSDDFQLVHNQIGKLMDKIEHTTRDLVQ